ncbi:MAG: hypothetical protein V4548_13160 [Bacteroidota bacterium]
MKKKLNNIIRKKAIVSPLVKLVKPAYVFISTSCFIVIWYIVGPFFQSETWQSILYKLKRKKKDFQDSFKKRIHF